MTSYSYIDYFIASAKTR